jgi:peroxiredoxin family protein
MTMNDAKLDEAALRAVALGMDVEAFLNSSVGRYIVTRAEQERVAWLEQLLNVDAEDAKEIRACQHHIGVIDAVMQWLADAVTEARNAEQQLYEHQE